MPLHTIDSLQDARLAPYHNIRYRDPSPAGNRFIAEGRLVVERLLSSRHRCESIVLEQGHHAEILERVQDLPDSPDVFLLSSEQIRTLVGFDFHRGVLACGQHIAPAPLRDFVRPAPQHDPARQGDLVLVMVGISDPENVGGLIRTAAAFDVSRVIMTPDAAHPYSRRVLRVSMAAALEMEFSIAEDIVSDLQRLRDELEYRTVATTLNPDACRLAEFECVAEPLAVLVGNERFGLPPEVQRVCSDQVTIPMSTRVDSLNANVATAIVLQAIRQRQWV